MLYGMGFMPEPRPARRVDAPALVDAAIAESATMAQRMLPALPSHRALVEHACSHGFPRI